MNANYTWTTDIEAGGFAGLKPFLVRLSEDHDCRLKILKDNSTFWKDKFFVEFKGSHEGLTALREEFVLSMTMFNLPSTVKQENYKITNIKKKDSENNREIIFELNASKKSKIKELAEAVADELMVASEVSEKNNGFLKGKTVQVSALGDRDKLQKFKAIFLSVLAESEERKNKKSKLRM